jgi:N-acetylmuramoyl-L-alanine amidase
MRLNWLLPSFLVFFLLASPASAARLLFWRFDANQNRLVFTTDQRVQPRAQLIFNPTRVVIDLPGIIPDSSPLEQLVGGAIRTVRLGQLDAQTTRLVIELNPGYTLNPQQVQFQGSYSNQWTVQLPLPQQMAQLTNPTPGLPGSTLPPGTSYPPGGLPRVPQGRIVVILDPGHGGPDPGAIGIGGLQEKNVILAIAQQVAAILNQQGIQAILTRTGDYDLDLEPRVQMAREDHANLFVSIHANSIDHRPDINGLETYYYSNNQFPLAQTIHQSILQSLDVKDRGVRQARFYVLRNNPMPAVLVEVGFVTGEQDAPRLANPVYQNQLAQAIARGILQYLQQNR